MTHGEIKAMLQRSGPSSATERRGHHHADRLPRPVHPTVASLLLGDAPPGPSELRWARFAAGLERHAMVTAELAATERRAA